MFSDILPPVIVLGITGALLGTLLAFAAKIFAVKQNELFEPILNALPGANCGACGFAGCSSYAKAVAEDGAAPNLCPVGGNSCASEIASLMGLELQKNTRMAAYVSCSGGLRAKKSYIYKGISDCHSAAALAGGPIDCKYGCLGLGSCVSSCTFDAIHIRDGVAVVDADACTACLKCIKTCPKGIIHAVPFNKDINVACSSHDKGGTLRKVCEIGCIGCRICEKACAYGAIQITDNLANINHEKCTGCGECAIKCPRNLIVDSKLDRSHGVAAVN